MLEHFIGLGKSQVNLVLGAVDCCRIGQPQCAETGCPGQTGQTSDAAESQTVKTKSIRGALGPLNSSQLLDLNESKGLPSFFRRLMAAGCTRPLG